MEKNDVLRIENLNVSFGETLVFRDFSIDLPKDKITCVLGPSGAGKTTLLKALCGLIPPKNGFIPPKCSFIFQDHRLLPNLTALDNLAVVLDGKRAERRKQAGKMLSDMELSDAANLYPDELSGGMAQRVAIARGLLFSGDLLLMDEPFKGLDLGLQERLIKYFVKHWEANPRTTVFVTHSILEAILVADRIVILEKPIKEASEANPDSLKEKSGDSAGQGARILYEKEFSMPREARALGVPEVDALRSQIHDILVEL